MTMNADKKDNVEARDALGRVLVIVAFFILFPVYFYYQTFAQMGFFNPAAGGFYTAAAVVSMPILLWAYWLKYGNNIIGFSFVGFLFALFIALFLMHVCMGVLRGANPEITSSHYAYIVKFVALFLIARMLDLESAKFQAMLYIVLFGIFVTVVYQASDGIFLQASLLSGTAGEFQLDYQGLGFAYIVLVIVCVPAQSLLNRYILYAISMPVLFLIGARSEFVGFLLIFVVIEFCLVKSRTFFVVNILILVMSILFIYILIEDSLQGHRMFALLQVSQDQSVIERKWQISQAINTITEYPLFGNYASYEAGNYAHNLLSVWVDLGIIGFFILSSLMAIPGARLVKDFAAFHNSIYYVETLACVMFLFLMMLFAKNYTYQMIPIAIGIYCKYREVRRNNIAKESA